MLLISFKNQMLHYDEIRKFTATHIKITTDVFNLEYFDFNILFSHNENLESNFYISQYILCMRHLFRNYIKSDTKFKI